MRLFKNAAGDTIVEVLIAIAVVSSVLGGAYVVVNRTIDNSLQAQEHTEALKIAETQLEQLKAAAETVPGVFDESDNIHCFDDNGNLVNFPGYVPSLPQAEGVYPAECKNLGSVNYRTGFVYTSGTSDLTDDYFTVYVNWPGPTGGQDQVSLVYKVYREAP